MNLYRSFLTYFLMVVATLPITALFKQNYIDAFIFSLIFGFTIYYYWRKA